MQREVQSVTELDAVNCMLHFEKFIQPVTAMNSILCGFQNVNLMLAKYSNQLCKEEVLNHKRFDEICSEIFSESFGNQKFDRIAVTDGGGFKLRIYNFSPIGFEGSYTFRFDVDNVDLADKLIKSIKIVDVFSSEIPYKYKKLSDDSCALSQSYQFEFSAELPPMGFAEFMLTFDSSAAACLKTVVFDLPLESSSTMGLVRAAKTWEEPELPTSFLGVSREQISSGVFKCAFSKKGGYVVSLYNLHNDNEDIILSVNFDIDNAYICNKSEEHVCELKVDCGEIRLKFKPFETKYIKFTVSKD